MKIIYVSTILLKYHPKEDRMLLLINRSEKESINFWVTRRFYFSLLFKLETFLEELDISYEPSIQNKQKSVKKQTKRSHKKDPKTVNSLLKNINIRFKKERKKFIFVFQSDTIEAQSVFEIEQFLNFYKILKNSFPKKEWGIMQ